MRYAITKRNTPQTHLEPRCTKDLSVRACAEHAHTYACAGKQTLARYARSGAPDSLRCPSDSLARYARSGFLPPSCGGNPRTTSSGQVERLLNRIFTPPCPIPLCYARPFAFGSLLACCLRSPSRSRFARFVAALRSRSVLICLVAPLRLVGVALIAGAPAPLTGFQPYAA